MGRKTAIENAQPIKLKKCKETKKISKTSVWQYLFDNRNKSFTVIQLANIFDVNDRKAIYNILGQLEKESVPEREKVYKVYKLDSSYRVFDEKGYEEYKSEQNKGKTIEDLIIEETDILNNPKMWTSDRAESFVPAIIIFYPLEKRKSYFDRVTRSLNKLFGKYILAILEGTKDNNSGLYIILKKHKNAEIIREYIEELYEGAAYNRDKKL